MISSVIGQNELANSVRTLTLEDMPKALRFLIDVYSLPDTSIRVDGAMKNPTLVLDLDRFLVKLETKQGQPRA